MVGAVDVLTIESLSYRDVARAIDHSLLRPELDLDSVDDGVRLGRPGGRRVGDRASRHSGSSLPAAVVGTEAVDAQPEGIPRAKGAGRLQDHASSHAEGTKNPLGQAERSRSVLNRGATN